MVRDARAFSLRKRAVFAAWTSFLIYYDKAEAWFSTKLQSKGNRLSRARRVSMSEITGFMSFPEVAAREISPPKL
jgi:hypothetical protein